MQLGVVNWRDLQDEVQIERCMNDDYHASMLERENLLVADACNPNPNPRCLPQLSPQSSDLTFIDLRYLISLCRNKQTFNVVELLCVSEGVVVLCFSFAQRNH